MSTSLSISTEPLASQIGALRAGQKILVVSRRADGTRELTSRYTVKRIGGAGWYVELEGPMGGAASIVVVEATRKVALCRGREERVVTSVRSVGAAVRGAA